MEKNPSENKIEPMRKRAGNAAPAGKGYFYGSSNTTLSDTPLSYGLLRARLKL